MAKLPAVPSGLSTGLRNFLSALTTSVKTIKADSQAARVASAQAMNVLSNAQMVSSTIPPAPTGVTASGAFTSVIVDWDEHHYVEFSFAEVWRSTTNVLSTAVIVGTTNGLVYTDEVGYDKTYYYWVRFVSYSNVNGPYGGPSSTSTEVNISAVLATLNDAISQSALTASLQTEIGKIPGIAANASNITTLQSSVGSNTTSVQTNATTINGLEAQYTVKIDNNGAVSGFGLASTTTGATPTSEFYVNADRFAIIHPTQSPNQVNTPFVVDGNKVYMETALIKDGSIENAKIKNLAVDSAKIADLAVTTAKITDANITNAKIANAAITTAKIDTAAITTAKIDTAAITTAKIDTAAITTAKIDTAAVDTLQIAGNAVTVPVNVLQSGSVTASARGTDVTSCQTAAADFGGQPVAIMPSFGNLLFSRGYSQFGNSGTWGMRVLRLNSSGGLDAFVGEQKMAGGGFRGSNANLPLGQVGSTGSAYSNRSASSISAEPFNAIFYDNPPTGTYSYRLVFRRVALGDTTSTPTTTASGMNKGNSGGAGIGSDNLCRMIIQDAGLLVLGVKK